MKRVARIDGMPVQHELRGDPYQTTVVFLHGLGSGIEQFRPQITYFANHYQVLAISLRGHGDSMPQKTLTFQDYAIERLASDVLGLLDELDIRDYHLVGSSLGGVVALEVARLGPDNLLSVTTFGTAFWLTVPLLAVGALLVAERAMITVLGPRRYARLMSRSAAKTFDAQNRAATMFEEMAKKNAAGLLHLRRHLGNYSYAQWLVETNLPILMVRAEHDRSINRMVQPMISVREQLPHLSVVDLEGAGYLANLDRPQAFNRILDGFFREVNRR